MALHTYVTAWGESVRSVAEKFRVPPDALRRLNGLAGETVPVGLPLRVPVLIGRVRSGPPETLARLYQLDRHLIRETSGGETLLLFIDEPDS